MKRVPELLLLLMLLTACHTVEPESYEATASVVSYNQSMVALGDAVLVVFQADGYTPLTNSRTDFVFEKPAGTWSNIAYGTLMDGKVWTRVKIHIERVNSTTHRLDADAFRIRGKGSSMEEKQHLARGHVGEYRKLLESVLHKANNL